MLFRSKMKKAGVYIGSMNLWITSKKEDLNILRKEAHEELQHKFVAIVVYSIVILINSVAIPMIASLQRHLHKLLKQRTSQDNPSLEKRIDLVKAKLKFYQQQAADRMQKLLEVDALYNQKPSVKETFEQLKALLHESMPKTPQSQECRRTPSV